MKKTKQSSSWDSKIDILIEKIINTAIIKNEDGEYVILISRETVKDYIKDLLSKQRGSIVEEILNLDEVKYPDEQTGFSDLKEKLSQLKDK